MASLLLMKNAASNIDKNYIYKSQVNVNIRKITDETQECPVCMDTCLNMHMIQGRNCIHEVCIHCIEQADNSSRPIDRCPMCRAEF